MYVLSISTDRSIFKNGSAVRTRVLKQAQYVKELHIIVFSNIFKHKNLQRIKITDNIWLYPTYSWSRLLYIRDAFKIAKKLIGTRLSARQDSLLEIGNSRNDIVITCQDPFESGYVGMKLKKIFNTIPLQIQVHTDFLSPHFTHTFLNKIRVNIARKVLGYAQGIRVVSKRIADSLVEDFKISRDNISILPVFVDIQKIIDAPIVFDLHKKYPQFNFIALMASRITKEKNIDLAIKSFSRVLKLFPKAGLVIVGDGPELSNVKKLTKALGISRSVIFENWNNDLSSYYKTANLFILTSLYEGFSMTLIEAAASGCPIVTSNVGIVGDILTDEHVIICSVHSETCFTENINLIIGNNQKRELLKQSARVCVIETCDISVDAYFIKYIDILNKTMK